MRKATSTSPERPVRYIRRSADRLARHAGRRLEGTLGGPERTRVILLLGAVLAMSSADTATVGAAATQLRQALKISNTDIGLLVAVTALVAAAFSIPFGVVADRFSRTRFLGYAIFLWGLAMIWSATATSFGYLLLARVSLGIVTAAAGPVVASLIGDYFASHERGKVYGYLLSGELVGAGIGFTVTGDIAAWSWRAAFIVLAIPTFFLGRAVLRLREPQRGGRSPLIDPATVVADAETVHDIPPGVQKATEAQRLAQERGVRPHSDLVLGTRLNRLGFLDAARYVLRIRTNVILIVASACGYFYLSGVQTFAIEFSKEQYRVNQAVASLLLLVLGIGALAGVLVAGRLADRLLRGGHLPARIVVSAVAALATGVLFVPALVTRHAGAALIYLVVAAFMLSAQNPPIDAARLDIVPSQLWGRAEGVRTALRTGAQALAPLLFGLISDHVFGGGRKGLQWTFIIMLLPLFANGILLVRAVRSYPGDVASAAAAQDAAVHAEDVETQPGGGPAPAAPTD
ncbi:MAG: MFS transporter, partial [Acidimicrobiales bacterium]